MALLAVAKQDRQNQQRYGTPDCDIFCEILHHGCHSAGLVTAARMMITMAAAVNASQGAARWSLAGKRMPHLLSHSQNSKLSVARRSPRHRPSLAHCIGQSSGLPLRHDHGAR
jgi:hypothetical protein